MNIFPAIDLYDGKAVRLVRGDYNQMTVYSDNPVEVAQGFERCGARFLHLVDLQGAKDNSTANFQCIKNIIEGCSLSVEVGGGIRSEQVIRRYLDIGVQRVILGTAAVEDEQLLRDMVARYGEHIAVGVDIKDGMVAVRGWTAVSGAECFEFCEKLSQIGVRTIICTDISKDGAMSGTNLELYKSLSERFDLDFIASGGVSSLDDVKALRDMRVYGAILGKALYTGAVSLQDAIKEAGQ